MTTQVLIFNKNGVAVASDSVLTIENGNSLKTLPNSRKIYDLPTPHKILVLQSGSVELNDLPIEIYLVKWGQSLTDQLPTTRDYALNFVSWLGENCVGIDEKPEIKIKETVEDFLIGIANQVGGLVEEGCPASWDPDLESYFKSNPVLAKNYAKVMKKVIEAEIRRAEDSYEFPFFTDETARRMLPPVLANELVAEWFCEKAISPNLRQKLVAALPLSLSRRVATHNSQMNLVFAGFGGNNMTSQGINMVLERAHSQMIQGWIVKEYNGYTGGTIVYPAQRQAMRSFLNGYHDRLFELIPQYVKEMLEEHTNSKLEPGRVATAKKQVETDELRAYLVEELQSKFDIFAQNHYSTFIDTISVMDVSGMIEIAESLAGMEILSGHNSSSTPTSGGLIEVASVDLRSGVRWHKKIPLGSQLEVR